MQRVLCFLTVNPDFVEFAIPELKALLTTCPVPLEVLFQEELQAKDLPPSHLVNEASFKQFPFVVLTVPDFESHRTCNACLK